MVYRQQFIEKLKHSASTEALVVVKYTYDMVKHMHTILRLNIESIFKVTFSCAKAKAKTLSRESELLYLI